ncbi:hypothetical protein OZL92_05845 [Bacillus sonorensis]|uniref:Membrane protein YyzH n=1 Tax=Bacillus sonorensis TaxID=119858 RepID=A0ABN5ATJ2_9BACI|nr:MULTISPECIES: hypothetical protein [Bacillus]TWK83678.1 hypothetical protein CHCC20335_4749 [Bacillus paralicheniformis]ASB91535.1 putative membrane protein YyzH [Bacillus sonorensis]MBG9914830.1 membrane protein [Bacillus sonorensis]MCF7615863.1 hypothetical protein [Bacillus sonorensis]MCY7858214.1 hypothetical protein [Bacillus sonorensis]
MLDAVKDFFLFLSGGLRITILLVILIILLMIRKVKKKNRDKSGFLDD